MGWATSYIAKLQQGETVEFRPRGNSMTPLIKSGQLCCVQPLEESETLNKGDIVLCTVRGNQYLHKVLGVRSGGKEVQIGNNHGRVNGWTSRNKVYGKLISVGD